MFKNLLKELLKEREDKKRYKWAKNIIDSFVKGIEEKGEEIISKPDDKILNVDGGDLDKELEGIRFSFQKSNYTNVASYWYDKANSRYVIILRILKSFDPEQFVKEVDDKVSIWKPQVIHEISHLYNDMVSNQQIPDPVEGGGKQYYLSDEEINAYFMEAVATFEDRAENDPSKIPMGVTDNFEVFKEWMMEYGFSPDFKKYANKDDQVKKRILKRLYQYYDQNVEGEIFI